MLRSSRYSISREASLKVAKVTSRWGEAKRRVLAFTISIFNGLGKGLSGVKEICNLLWFMEIPHTLAKLLYLYFNQNFFLSKIWLPLWNELMGHIFNFLKYNFNRFTENSNLNAVWPDFLSEIFAQRFFIVSKIFTDWRFTLN